MTKNLTIAEDRGSQDNMDEKSSFYKAPLNNCYQTLPLALKNIGAHTVLFLQFNKGSQDYKFGLK